MHEAFGSPYKVSAEEVEAALQTEQSEESRTLDMQQVWFSRPEGLDKRNHYVLIIGGSKYELRNKHKPRYNTDSIEVRHIDSQRYQSRVRIVREPHLCRLRNPRTNEDYDDRYNVFLIGWTNKAHVQIDAICKKTISNWRYRTIYQTNRGGNCQHFVRSVAEQIIAPEYRASAWPYFRNDVYGPIQKWQHNRAQEQFMGTLRTIYVDSPLGIARELAHGKGR
ncbi:hypothetical protein BJX64DRAFT_275342 [Aspergillus heterothallicus]